MLPDLPDLSHFHFLRPAWALLLPLVLAIIWVRRRRQAQRDLFGGIIAPHLLEHLRLRRRDAHWFNPSLVSAVLSAMLLLILLGPSWRQQPSPLAEDEAALVILLDVSASMQQADVQPSRLQRAQQKVSDLLALRPDKKAALVVYSGSAHTVLPLTADRDILTQYLAAIRPGIMPRSGKFPEYTLPLVDDILRDTRAPATLLLLADGLGADSAAAFRDWFDARPHQLLVVGVGSETPPEGVAPLDRGALAALAGDTGGHYVDLTVDDSDMRHVDRRIDSHYVVVEDSALPWLDSGYPLVFPAMALFLLWFRRGWTLTWGWLLLPLVLHTAPTPALAQEEPAAEPAAQSAGAAARALDWFAGLWLTGDQQGRLLLQLGDYRAAAARFEDPLWRGIAAYYAEDFMLAAEYFSRSDTNRALFNEANARAQARDYVRAVARYDRLLARSPDYPGAARNRDIVQAIIDEINRISASQQPEQGVGSRELDPDGDEAVPAQGAEELTWEQAELKHYTADEILQDAATRDMWLRGVQQDPAGFLANKFDMQLRRAGEPAP